VLHALITFAQAEHEEPSKTLFYIAGILLAAFALIVSAIGITRHETFPPSRGAARGVMALAVVLVVFTMASAVLTG
jgi:glucan phosphoethanolaminetransferase (alkaline phosphatase superfamily)